MPTVQELQLPHPEVPSPGVTANSLRDFSVFLAEDRQCVGAVLDRRFSPRHATLFKFAASVAVCAFYRYQAPSPYTAMEFEVMSYGTAAGIPPEVWQPLLTPADAAKPVAERKRETEALVQRIEYYVSTSH
jgi:hypothetical protein